MSNITHSQHTHQVGKFELQVDPESISLFLTEDGMSRLIFYEDITTGEMMGLAKALYGSAVIREKIKELLEDEMRFDHEEELREEL